MATSAQFKQPDSDQLWLAANDHLHGTPSHPQDDCLAFELFTKAALLGNKLAQKQVADMVMQGVGTKKNYILALDWYEKAAKDSITNTLWLAQSYLTGANSLKQDGKAAVRLYKSFADKGDTQAIFALANLHERGQAAEQSYALARGLFEKNAANGHIPSMIKLSNYLANGLGGPVDNEKSEHWLELATIQSKL